MKIIHITAWYEAGGAASVVRTLHAGLRDAGVDSRVVSGELRAVHAGVERFQSRAGSGERLVRALRHAVTRYQWRRGLRGLTSPYDAPAFLNEPLSEEIARRLPDADVYHLHWMAGFASGFKMLPLLTRRGAVLWTFHDMEPTTGGCSHSKGCQRFAARCGRCPFLGEKREDDLSRRVFEAKRRCLERSDRDRIHIHVASRWMEEQVRNSSLWTGVPVTRIPLGIDTTIFHARNRIEARRALTLPEDKTTVLFAAARLDNPIKGFATLLAALEQCLDRHRIHLLLAGDAVGLRLDELPVAHTHYGAVGNPQLMNLIMRATDIFVMPSQWETFGLSAAEAIASGCVCILCDTSGLRDVGNKGSKVCYVPKDNPEALADALSRHAESPVSRNAESERDTSGGTSRFIESIRDLYGRLCLLKSDS